MLERIIAMKRCISCGENKPEEKFYRRISKTNKIYRYKTCGECYRKKNMKRINEAQKKYRATGKMQAFFVKNNAKTSDRKKGRDFDLDINFVKELISRPCSYCERTSMFMGLDRIDNSLGHLKTNVLPSCRRCNLIRNSMPFKAWEVVAEGVKKATQLGLFEDWEGQTFKAQTCH